MPLRATPEEASQAWREGLGRAGPKIERGVDRVTQAPGQKAAAKKTAYVAGVQAMADEWARRVAAVPLADWQQSVKDSLGRITGISDLKARKYSDRIAPVFSHMNSIMPSIDSMPTDSLDQRINKSSEYQRKMAAYKKRTGG